MSRAIEWVIDFLITLFLVVFAITAINVSSTVRKAQAINDTATAELSASDFSAGVVDKYKTAYKTDGFVTTVTPPKDGSEVYTVTTDYKYSIPVIGVHRTGHIVGYAR